MGKFIKKAFAMVAALLMALAVAAPALAETSRGTIKILNPKDGVTYTAYQVFKASVNNGKVSYTLQDNDIIGKILADTTNAKVTGESPSRVINIAGLILTESSNGFSVEKTDAYNAATFAQILKSYGFGTDPLDDVTNVKLESPNYTASNVAGGYYLILSSDDVENKPSMTTVLELEPGQTVVVENKNDVPFDKVIDKVADSDLTPDDPEIAPVNIGDVVTFKLTGKVPDTTEYTGGYLYKVSDTMDSGLTFNKNVVVTIGTGNTAYTVPITVVAGEPDNDQIKYTDNGFVLSLDMKQYEGKNQTPIPGDVVTITYTATVNENAHAVLEGNKARLDFSNDPTDWTKTGKVDDRVDVYNYDILVDKYEAGEESQKLFGAQFKLVKYSTTGANGTTVSKSTEGAVKYYYKLADGDNGAPKTVAWDSTEANGKIETTNEYGAALFIGLQPGTYYLEEVTAPTGYKIRENPIEVVISNAPAGIASLAQAEQHSLLTSVASVPNTPGENLPSTGGRGTTIFYIASAAVLAIIVLRFMRHDQEQVA